MGLARVGDPDATRTVYTTIVILALLGVALLALAVWVFRRTRPESELLAPLETMQTREWRKLDPAAQRRLLDEARPTGAAPLKREASKPVVDSSFATVAPNRSFEDLSDGSGGDDDADDADADEVTDAKDSGESALDPIVDDSRPPSDTDTVDDTGELPDGSQFGFDVDNDVDDDDIVDEDELADDVDDGNVDDDLTAEDADVVEDERAEDAEPADDADELADEPDDVSPERLIDPLLAPKPASPRSLN